MDLQFTSTKLSPRVMDAIRGATITPDGEHFNLDTYHLPNRKDYDQFKQVVNALRGHWNRKTHAFEYDPSAKIQAVLESGFMPHSNPGAFFPTPEELRQHLYLLMDLPESSDFPYRILEPHGGTGAFALDLRKKFPNAQIDVCELDPFNREILIQQGFNVIGEDWLKTETGSEYDYILANPPFKGQEYLKHVLKMREALRVSGRCGVIMPMGLTFNFTKDAVTLKNYIATTGMWETREDKPFREQGTDVSVLVAYFERASEEEESKTWGPSLANGFPSLPALNMAIALDCDREWESALTKCPKSKLALQALIDQHARRLIGQCHYHLAYNDTVRDQLAEHYLEEIE